MGGYLTIAGKRESQDVFVLSVAGKRRKSAGLRVGAGSGRISRGKKRLDWSGMRRGVRRVEVFFLGTRILRTGRVGGGIVLRNVRARRGHTRGLSLANGRLWELF